MYAHPEALKHFQRALEIAALSGFDRAPLAERAAEAASAAGEAQLAIALAHEAVELAGPERAAEQHARLARLLWDAGRGREALAASERALQLIAPGRTVARACLLESHARLLLLTGQAAHAVPVIEEALAVAREQGALDVEAAVLATRVIALQEDADVLIEAGAEALQAAKRHGDADTLMRAYINAAEALDHRGRVSDAIELGREGVQAAERLNLERVMGVHMQGEIACRLLRLGRSDEAASTIADGLRAVPEGAAAVALHDSAAVIAARRGDPSGVAAETAFSRANADEAGSGQSIGRGTAALAEVALWQHDAERAWSVVDTALTLVRRSEYVWYSAPLYALGAWALADCALSARAGGADDEAEQAATSATALLARFDQQPLDPRVPEPSAYRAQAAAELSRLADTPAPDAWARARTRWEQLEYPFHAALCGWREAEALLLGEGDRTRAGELLKAATGRAETIGATALVGEIDALARRARLTVAADEELPAHLTARELDVLRLIARGLTNREIGEELFISVKTVSVHVSRVLSKLGAANRAQAATVAHRLGIE
jgi:DNA-binding CsgD family transcriptional regulator/tetratricopeptide (TPR) repeat protein